MGMTGTFSKETHGQLDLLTSSAAAGHCGTKPGKIKVKACVWEGMETGSILCELARLGRWEKIIWS